MDCEICGQSKAVQTISMDGQKLLVCNECQSFGVKVFEEQFAQKQPVQTFKPVEKKQQEFEMTENFGDKIRRAREQKNMTLKELADQIFEKESFLHKVEQGKHSPDQRLAKKLEKFFNIHLME